MSAAAPALDDPRRFAPTYNFGAGGDARRLIALAAPRERAAAYAWARTVAEGQSARRVIDLGAGAGFGPAFAGFVGELCQADWREPAEATGRFMRCHLEDTGDLARLSDALGDETPTVLILADGFERLQDPRALLRVVRGWLKRHPANRLVLAAAERPAHRDGLPEDPGHVRQWTQAELAAALAACGLTVHRIGRLADAHGPAPTVVAEVSCCPESHRAFLRRHGWPDPAEALLIGEAPGEGALRLFTGPESAEGPLHVARLIGPHAPASGGLPAEDVLDATLQVVFIYDGLRAIHYADHMGLGVHVAQAKRARLLPPSVTVVAQAVGTHFARDHAQGDISRTRDLQIDVAERLSLELADAVVFAGPDLQALYENKQGLSFRRTVRTWLGETLAEAPQAAPAAAPRGAVTVIVPNYNGQAHFFEELIRGLHGSYHGPAEVIFIDDGSDAAGLARLARAEADVAPIPVKRLATPANLGPATARNVGLASVTTPYVCAHDNDNIVSNRFLDLACRILDENPDVAVVTTWMMAFNDGDGWLAAQADPPAFRFRPLGPDVGLGLRQNCFGDCLAVYRTEAVRAMGGWDTSIGGRREDRQLFLRLTASGRPLWVLPLSSFFYRVHPASRMRTIPEFDGWIGLGRALPGMPYNQAFGLVRAANTAPPVDAEAHARLAEAHAQLADVTTRLAEAHARLQAIEASTTWRLTGAVRGFLAGRPALRHMLGAVGRLARQRRP